MPVLQTDRLLLRPFEEGDLDEYADIAADPDVNRYLGSDPMDRIQAWQSMAYFLGHERLRGWSNNAVIETATGRLLGRCGLYRPEGWPGLEVGWLLGRFAWGRGFATEAATSWRDWAFAVVQTEELISVIHRDNVRSMKVAERIGHRFLRDYELRGIPCVIYGQRRPPYEPLQDEPRRRKPA
jgi:RimJ/RimL family protein N-acetyltransferase